MDTHSCLLSLGSNTSPANNLELARKELHTLFPSIRFGQEIETEPLFFKTNKNIFHNQLGKFGSRLSPKELTVIFKRIEKLAGRQDNDKQAEVVKLDLDLLVYDDLILKEKDLERGYMKKLMDF